MSVRAFPDGMMAWQRETYPEHKLRQPHVGCRAFPLLLSLHLFILDMQPFRIPESLLFILTHSPSPHKESGSSGYVLHSTLASWFWESSQGRRPTWWETGKWKAGKGKACPGNHSKPCLFPGVLSYLVPDTVPSPSVL